MEQVKPCHTEPRGIGAYDTVSGKLRSNASA